MNMGFDIVQFLMGPADILTQGLVGLIMGLGMNALQIWLMYEIVVIVPPRSKNLIDAIDVELSQSQHYGGLKCRVYRLILQSILPLVLVCSCYLIFCFLTSVVTAFF